jgi:transposase-like protein
MDAVVDEKKLKELVSELAKQVKTEKDLGELSDRLTKMTVEAALGAEMEDHLGYEKHAPEGRNTGNSRNGKSSKKLKGKHGEVEIDTPRDRNGTFEPKLLGKYQTRLTAFDDQILCLYAKGMTTRQIVDAFQEMYGAEVSSTLVSKVTDAVIDQMTEWQSRPLDPLYPIVYLDCIVVKVRQNKQVINKSIYIALGIDLEGHKQLLGLWIAETEGAKFWLSVLTELKNRGLEDILIACVDGLSGFPQAIEAVYPETRIQLCIVHMVRNSLKYVSWKDYKAVTRDLKKIYQAPTEAEARRALEAFGEAWDEKYCRISKIWESHWPYLITFFDYPPEIRKAIYTTNAIESLNSVIRKATRQRKIFPHDESALKVTFMAIRAASQKWTRPIQNWKDALNQFIIQFEDRVTDHL